MEEYWEVVSYEYDFTGGGVPTFTLIVKRKVEKAPHQWNITWRDANGIKIAGGYPFILDTFNKAKVGEPVQATSHAPFKDQMPKVKSVTVTENPDRN